MVLELDSFLILLVGSDGCATGTGTTNLAGRRGPGGTEEVGEGAAGGVRVGEAPEVGIGKVGDGGGAW